MRYLNLRPSQVILDPDNPRLPDGTNSDREAINRLLDDGADALIALARDMARTGQSNPAELPIAIKDGNRYLIVEGNRRFAALKLLKDPALAYDEEQQNSFRRAARLGEPPKTVFTLIMPSRDEADHWIVLRHTGENNGVGVKRWSAGQTATHRRRANKTIDSGTARSIIIADDLEEAYAADEEIVDLIRQVRRGKLTNIGRFFSPDVLGILHFTINNDDKNSLRPRSLYVRHSSEQLRDFFAWALAYILNNPVDAYKNAAIRRDLLLSVANLLPKPEEAAPEPFSLIDRAATSVGESQPDTSTDPEPYDSPNENNGSTGSLGGQDSNENQGTAMNETSPQTSGDGQAQRPRKAEAKLERYLFQGLKLPNHPDRIQRLLMECRSLDIESYQGIACVMARIIVELSVSSQSALALSGASESSALKIKIIEMLRYLDPQIEHPRNRDPELAQAYLEASELGIQYLNGFVHNPSLYPDQHLARRFSNAFRPLLERLDAEL